MFHHSKPLNTHKTNFPAWTTATSKYKRIALSKKGGIYSYKAQVKTKENKN